MTLPLAAPKPPSGLWAEVRKDSSGLSYASWLRARGVGDAHAAVAAVAGLMAVAKLIAVVDAFALVAVLVVAADARGDMPAAVTNIPTAATARIVSRDAPGGRHALLDEAVRRTGRGTGRRGIIPSREPPSRLRVGSARG